MYDEANTVISQQLFDTGINCVWQTAMNVNRSITEIPQHHRNFSDIGKTVHEKKPQVCCGEVPGEKIEQVTCSSQLSWRLLGVFQLLGHTSWVRELNEFRE